MTVAPSVQLRIELRDLEAQVRRMGNAFRNKKLATEFTAAEVSALYHLAEVRSLLEKVAE